MDSEIILQDNFSLYNSHFCRLCAEENPKGYPLFQTKNDERNLSDLINSYLPFKVTDDGKYPKWICPGCHLQVESTIQFFDLVMSGQKILENLCNRYSTDQRSNDVKITVYPENPSDVSSSTLSLLYPENMRKKISTTNNLEVFPDKPKKKRGRPSKRQLQGVTAELDIVVADPNIDHTETLELQPGLEKFCTSRRKRQIKVPSRYRETVQGKELDRAFIESGLSDQNDNKSFIDELDGICTDNLIGYVQNNDGENLGDLIMINGGNENFRKKNAKKTRFMCDICKMSFCYEQKFLQHRLSHHNVQFECIECLLRFNDRNGLVKHQSETEHAGEGLIEDFTLQKTVSFSKENEAIKQLQPASTEISINNSNLHNTDRISDYKTDRLDDVLCKIESLNEPTDNLNNEEDTPLDGLIEEVEDLIKSDETNIEVSMNERSIIVEENHSENGSPKKSSKTVDLKCNISDITFNCSQSYVYHKDPVHYANRRFVCSKCSKCFKNKTLLQRHQLVHSNIRPHICTYCQATFKTKTHLAYHKTSHTGEKKYQCKVCDNFFAFKNSLTLHMRCHTGFKPNICPECGKAFAQHGNLREHMRIHTGECPYECKICGRKFKTSSQVRMHTKRHRLDRPFKCNICDKTFVQYSELKNHQRRHYNIKPYSCSICGKSFTDAGALRKHMHSHTGAKPYPCPECQRRFADRSNLKKHRKVHERKRREIEASMSLKDSNDRTLDGFVESPDIRQENSLLNAVDENSLIEDSSMWDLIEEDGCAERGDTSERIEPPDMGGNSQLVNITYQDPEDPLKRKITLFVVQENSAPTSTDSKHKILDQVILNEPVHENQLFQPTNMFMGSGNSDSVANTIQTVIFNLQNSGELHLERTCDLFRDNSEANNDISQISGDHHKDFVRYTDTLDIPD